MKGSKRPMKRFSCILLILALLANCVPAFAQDVVTDAALDTETVKCLQIDLISGGYLEGDADGVMGSGTQEAIRTAQRDLGLPVNGCISDELSTALQRNVFPMKLECRSSLVYEMQKPLFQCGFLEDDPTGFYGSSTMDAVVSFQKFAVNDFAAYMQGISDAKFAEMDIPDDLAYNQPIYSAQNIPCDGIMTEDWYNFLMNEFEYPRITTMRGEVGDNVKIMQVRLHALGYLYTGMDGKFSDVTELALKYFQRKNGLSETGVCDENTSSVLFSQNAVYSDEYVMPIMAYVKRSKSRVYVYGWDGSGYNEELKVFRCSCGKPSTPTLKGTYYCIGPISEWYYMQSSNVWVKYAFQIKGNYFFHSVLFSHKGNKYPTSTSVRNLGSNVSHGCIRLAVDDIKWLYEHGTVGMKVVIE